MTLSPTRSSPAFPGGSTWCSPHLDASALTSWPCLASSLSRSISWCLDLDRTVRVKQERSMVRRGLQRRRRWKAWTQTAEKEMTKDHHRPIMRYSAMNLLPYKQRRCGAPSHPNQSREGQIGCIPVVRNKAKQQSGLFLHKTNYWPLCAKRRYFRGPHSPVHQMIRRQSSFGSLISCFVSSRFADVFFAADGSRGPFSQNPRLRSVHGLLLLVKGKHYSVCVKTTLPTTARLGGPQ